MINSYVDTLVMRGGGGRGDPGTSKAIWMRCLGMSGSACPRQWTRSGRCSVASCQEYCGGNSSFEFWEASKPGQVFCPRLHLDSSFPSCALGQSETLWG